MKNFNDFIKEKVYEGATYDPSYTSSSSFNSYSLPKIQVNLRKLMKKIDKILDEYNLSDDEYDVAIIKVKQSFDELNKVTKKLNKWGVKLVKLKRNDKTIGDIYIVRGEKRKTKEEVEVYIVDINDKVVSMTDDLEDAIKTVIDFHVTRDFDVFED